MIFKTFTAKNLFANSRTKISALGILALLSFTACDDKEDENLIDTVSVSASTINYDYLVPAGTATINGDAETAGDNEFVVDAKGGTVIALEAGDYPDLNIKNIHGNSGNPVTIINYGGKVNIGTNAYSTVVKIIDSSNFRFTGSGSGDNYGIAVDGSNASRGEHAVEVYGVSTDFEIDHIEVFKSTHSGIVIKSDPKTFNPEVWRENFEMKNVSVHDNYVHDVGGEGLYIGYTGDGIPVEGGVAMPHLIAGLKVYNNRVENTLWDGIQVNRAYRDVEVYNNTITNYGTEKNPNQNSGMDIGYETVGKFYNNHIKTGDGIGIQVKGDGDVALFNNLIENPGYDGIYVNDFNADEGRTGYQIVNNTVVNTGHFGIRLVNFKSTLGNEDTRDWVANNIVAKVVGEGLGDRDYIHLANNEDAAMLTNSNNLTYETVDQAGFSSGYRLSDGAEAIDAGLDVAHLGIRTDLDGNPRPQGNGYDVGAFESGYEGENPPTDPGDGDINPDIPLTKVSDNECGRMDGSMEDMIWANEVDGATAYEFKVESSETGYSETLIKSGRFMKLKDFAGAQENVVYQISVRAIIGDERGGYGEVCEFQVGGEESNDPKEDPNLDPSLPTTQVSNNECGRMDGSMEDMIWADAADGVDSYEFIITDEANDFTATVKTTSRFVKLKNFQGAQTDVVYNIQVRTVKGDMHSNYGDTCEFQATK
ncbi:right-handed parallel beta-helix repeat-containing protein [Sediminitomix flava]|uniref:Parallel beta helix pectate lyase-like protein n=1 Tax=Sediminitomix flava TaxID=379075 RepID=A0A315ZGP2_SEDFL|nr:right-handed parallel beta-helix repeat-containing protein [Sediminitomix flava]PWJ44028.1 parallel beta helix pectate lyase-like protein [Sediminitomix flava]